MYKNKDKEDFCVITRLKMAMHDLDHAKSGLGKGDPKHADHYIEEARDDIMAVIDYIKGCQHGHEHVVELLRECLPELKEMMESKAAHTHTRRMY